MGVSISVRVTNAITKVLLYLEVAKNLINRTFHLPIKNWLIVGHVWKFVSVHHDVGTKQI